MDTLLLKAIEQMFPDLDNDLKIEIHNRTSGHFFEVLKDEIFRNNNADLEKFNAHIGKIIEADERSRFYGEELGKKLQALPEARQKEISGIIEKEIARVMHDLYTAYKS